LVTFLFHSLKFFGFATSAPTGSAHLKTPFFFFTIPLLLWVFPLPGFLFFFFLCISSKFYTFLLLVRSGWGVFLCLNFASQICTFRSLVITFPPFYFHLLDATRALFFLKSLSPFHRYSFTHLLSLPGLFAEGLAALTVIGSVSSYLTFLHSFL